MKTAGKTFPVSSTATDPATGHTYVSTYDMFTVGAGYVNLAAALTDYDVASKSAASPSLQYSLLTHVGSLAQNPSLLWNSTAAWSTNAVWGTTVLPGGTVWNAANVWSTNAVWGTMVTWGTGGGTSGTMVTWGTGGTGSTMVTWGTSGSGER